MCTMNEELICYCIIIPFIKYILLCASCQLVVVVYKYYIGISHTFLCEQLSRCQELGDMHRKVLETVHIKLRGGHHQQQWWIPPWQRCTCPCWWMTSGGEHTTDHALPWPWGLDLPSVTPWFLDEDSQYGVEILAVNNIIDVARRM